MRVLGMVYLMFSALPLVPAPESLVSLEQFLLTMMAAAIFVGPGIWYWIASFLIPKGGTRAIDQFLWIAGGQAIVTMCGAVLGYVAGDIVLEVSALISFLSLPVVGGICWHLHRARQGMRDLAATGHGFQPVKIQPALEIEGTERNVRK